MALAEFRTSAELRANYKAVKARLAALGPSVASAPEPAPPKPVTPRIPTRRMTADVENFVHKANRYDLKTICQNLLDYLEGRARNDDFVHSSGQFRRTSISEIMDAVRRAYGLTLEEIIGHSQLRRIARPRQIICYLASRYTLHSFPQLGRRLGNRDHTTIMHGRDKIAELRIIDPRIDQEVRELEAQLGVKVPA